MTAEAGFMRVLLWMLFFALLVNALVDMWAWGTSARAILAAPVGVVLLVTSEGVVRWFRD